MRQAKVLFKDNKATSASIIGENFDRHLQINLINNKRIIESFIVWGNNKNDAMELATDVVDKIATII